MRLRIIILSVLCIFAVVAYGQSVGTLPPDEVESMRVIGGVLGKTDWDFSVDPCSGQSTWAPNNTRNFEYSVTCNCSFENNTVCHVVSIIIKAQSLPGTVPREFVRLPFLQEIDLTRNYLNGTIPREWGVMNLVNISLLGNRITGSIPSELANISTLANLNLEYNQLSGSIPPEFGNLPRIERLTLNSNNLSGEVPASLGNLTTLRDFRISDNNFTGSVPDFIGSWTTLERIRIQGSGLSGPIPSSISSLTRLIDVRISDLNGNDSTIPSFVASINLERLILRSCNLIGQIPLFFGEMSSLNILDLSFNRLSGPIPDNFVGLRSTGQIYLTGNSLDGPVPAWIMLQEGQNIDLSYNNLSIANPPPNCNPGNTNLFASTKGNTTGIVPCIRSSACPRTYYSFHINCGGREVNHDNSNYEEDTTSSRSAHVYSSGTNWAYSSTGQFLDDNDPTDPFIKTNHSAIIGQNPQLYMDARISPLSLTYYGFCLHNGNYTVDLHFAEVMFTQDRTYFSLGRRFFDIYIQGNLVRRNFNIEEEAGGVNIGIMRNFTAVVTDGTLDIRFYWAGKGTTGIPVRGVYGPLISAISVNPNFHVPSENGSSISTGAIVGIVLGILLGAVLCLVILWWIGCFTRKDTLEYELKDVDLQTTSFSLRQIKAATYNFDSAHKIGEGGFGPVYKGILSDGTTIAVKMLSAKSKQGNREFVTEIGMISALQHPYLVKLHGCCIEGNNLLLIYEYLENNSLARALFGPEEHQIHLDWPTRRQICIGIAKGLAYLHEESRLKIVHRDIKATNVLLDKNLNPKISDFGLAKLDDENGTHMSTRVAGTYGYMAPEYAMRGHLTEKADVYSFGIVLLEVVSGKANTSFKTKEECFYLLDWANELNQNGNLMELVDSRFESKFNKEEALTAIHVALHCTNVISTERPSMSSIVSILEGKYGIQDFVSDSSVSFGKTTNKKMIDFDQLLYSNYDERPSVVSIDVPWTGSPTATSDVFPLVSDFQYWEKRDGYQ